MGVDKENGAIQDSKNILLLFIDGDVSVITTY